MSDAIVPQDGPAEGASETEARRVAGNEVLLDALAAGRSYSEAGVLAGVAARTVRRRMAEPAFVSELARRRAMRVSDIAGRLLWSSERALGVLEECLDADRPADRLRAAELILTMTRRFRTEVDTDARLVALESPAAPAEVAEAEEDKDE